MTYKSLLDIENSHSGISLILIDKPVVESDETNRSSVKMSNGPSRRTSTKCLYWIAPRPQYSLAQTAELNKTREPAFKKKKNLSQISDIPISEAVRPSHGSPHSVMYKSFLQGKTKSNSKHHDFNHRVRRERVRPKGILSTISYGKTCWQVSRLVLTRLKRWLGTAHCLLMAKPSKATQSPSNTIENVEQWNSACFLPGILKLWSHLIDKNNFFFPLLLHFILVYKSV